jgi:hypothetical protein
MSGRDQELDTIPQIYAVFDDGFARRKIYLADFKERANNRGCAGSVGQDHSAIGTHFRLRTGIN